MIIAAFSGCGKTTFAEKVWGSIDMVCVPYKYIMPDEFSGEEAEPCKGDYGCPMNPEWPENYISAIMTAYHRYQYVVIPTVIPVLEALQKFRIPYILCYPERSARDEYRRRYRERGNTNAFESIFIGRWDEYIDRFEQDEYGTHLVLKQDEYLLDHLKFITEYTEDQEAVVQFDYDLGFRDGMQSIFESTGVCIEEQIRQWMLWMKDNPDEFENWVKSGHLEEYPGLASLRGIDQCKI